MPLPHFHILWGWRIRHPLSRVGGRHQDTPRPLWAWRPAPLPPPLRRNFLCNCLIEPGMDNDVSNAHLGHVQRLVRARTMQQGARIKKSGPVAEGAANNIQPLALQPQLMHVCFIQLQLMHRHVSEPTRPRMMMMMMMMIE